MSLEYSINRFRLISGLSDKDCAPLLPLIKDALEYVRALVTKRTLDEHEEIRLSNAAAVYAYYRFVCYGIEDDSSVTLGSIRYQANQSKIEHAERMWETELKSLSDLTGGSGFVFRRVM